MEKVYYVCVLVVLKHINVKLSNGDGETSDLRYFHRMFMGFDYILNC